MNIIKHIHSQWVIWGTSPQLFFVSKEAMVCAVMAHIDILNDMGYIKINSRKAYLSFFKLEGALVTDLEEKVTKDIGAEIISKARILVKENLSDDEILF